MDDGHDDEAAASASVLPLFLGLFLALLAFFILFSSASIASRDRGEVSANDRHAPDRLAPDRLAEEAGHDPDAIALAAVAEAFGKLGASLNGQPVPIGEGLDLDISSRALFSARSSTIRPVAMAALDRAAAALAAPRGDVRMVLQITFGLGRSEDAGPGLLQRAARLGETLLRRGTPPTAFSTGIAPVTSDRIQLRFRLVGKTDGLEAAF